MKKSDLRKTLGMKCTQEFYDEVQNFVRNRGMTVSSLIRLALKETYDLEELPIQKKSRNKEKPEETFCQTE